MLEQYDIRLCRGDEAAKLRVFIGEHWKPGHVLATSQELLDWQHLDAETGDYNFVVAEHRPTGEFHAVYGFIPVSHFDPALKAYRDYWPAIWKVREDIEAPGLGMFVYYFLVKQRRPRSLFGFGMNPDLAPLAKRISHRMGALDHYYRVNEDLADFSLVNHFDGRYASPESASEPRKALVRCDDGGLVHLADQLTWRPTKLDVPVKSLTYLENRYCRHPWYDYQVHAVESGGRFEALLVSRICSHEERHALRIVDYFGEIESLAGCRDALRDLLAETGAEYVDFYNLGYDPGALASAGFLLREPDSAIVIPNYYEPFVRRNESLDYVIYTDVSKFRFVFVKGDTDQDRPNRLAEGIGP
jgi:hypothetical protein